MLEPATSYAPWYSRYAASVVALVVGGAALLSAFWTQFCAGHDITRPSDLRIVLPLGGTAIASAIVALVRREPERGLAVGAIAMAAAAPLLGWAVLVATVAAVAV